MTRRVLVVTGTRAEFGLLRSTMSAVQSHSDLDLIVVAAGAHLLPPARTIDEVRSEFDVAAEIPMQVEGEIGRTADSISLGRGVSGCAEAFARLHPDVVVVLGDRIEAFAAASAASIAGIPLAHLHGGDRAEGVADEAMRHAISQLADLHFAATETSGDRLRRMGQDPSMVHVVGSPAVDDLGGFPTLDDDRFRELGSPRTVVLHHGCGIDFDQEVRDAAAVLDAAIEHGNTLVLDPNHDPGSDAIRSHLRARATSDSFESVAHLPRPVFIGLLRRIDALVGNSSAGLIEAAVVGCPAVNVGARQGGRERPESVIDVDLPSKDRVLEAIQIAAGSRRHVVHPYGESGVGERIASIVAEQPIPMPRKRLAY